MADLSGSLGFMPCRDVFRYLGNRSLSGTLSAGRGTAEKKVVIRQGAAISAASTDPREYLGQILINAGHLTEEAFHKAYQTQLETRVPLGQILSMIGLVPADVIERALAIKIRETALDLCSWREGSFAFTAHPVDQEAGIGASVTLAELCQEAENRARVWEAIRKALPSGDVRLELVPGKQLPLQAEESVESRVLALLADGPRTLDELLLHLHATEFRFYQRLFALLQEGAIRVQGRKPAEPGAPPAGEPAPEAWFPEHTPPPLEDRSSGEELLAMARAALLKGELEAAAELAGRAADKSAGPESLEILKRAESQLLQKLRGELLDQRRIPVVTVDKAQVKAMPLTPPERYLLARMDGARELGAIVRVSPLREIDALRLVKKFLQAGMIRF